MPNRRVFYLFRTTLFWICTCRSAPPPHRPLWSVGRSVTARRCLSPEQASICSMSVRDPYSGRPTNFVWLPKERAPESSSPCVTKTTTTLLSSTFRFNSLSGRVLFCGLGGAEWSSAAAIHNSSSCCYEAVSRREAQIQLLRHCPPNFGPSMPATACERVRQRHCVYFITESNLAIAQTICPSSSSPPLLPPTNQPTISVVPHLQRL